MRKPTHQPPIRPAIKNMSEGGRAFANEFAPYQTLAITAPNTTSVTARQKKTVAGLKGSVPQRAFRQHTAKIDRGELA